MAARIFMRPPQPSHRSTSTRKTRLINSAQVVLRLLRDSDGTACASDGGTSDPAAGVTSAGPRAGFSAGTIADLQAAAGPSTP